MLLKPSRIALAQTSSILGDVRRNVERHVEIVERAISEKADAVIFPELSLSGYTVRDLNFECAIRSNDEVLSPLRKLSKKITIIAGAVEEDYRGAVCNAALLFESGEVGHIHRKVYPPNYGIFEEARYFTSGRAADAFTSERLGRIGILICEDLWHPSLPYILAHDGAQLIIGIAASPTRLVSSDGDESSLEIYNINREDHAVYARLFGCYIAYVNRVGVEDGMNFWGGSEVVAPSGERVARAKFFDEDLVLCDIAPNLVRQSRQLSRHFLDDDPLLTQHLLSRLLERK